MIVAVHTDKKQKDWNVFFFITFLFFIVVVYYIWKKQNNKYMYNT